MASDLGDAVLNLKVDSKDFESGLNKAEGSAKSFGSSVSKSADDADKKMSAAGQSAGGLGSKLGGVASVAGGFIVAQGITQMGGYLMDAAKGAAADEQATMRLQQTLHNLGGDYDGNLAKVNAAISAGEKLAFTDDDVRDSFQFLANATGDTDEALRRQTVAMDLARGANIPLATATKMVGKVNEENVEAFKKLGITIGENATEADALAAVQAKYAGQSEAYASGTAGQFEVAQIRMAEAQETIGTAILPAMTALANVVSTVLPPAFTLLGAAIAPISAAIEWLVEHAEPLLPLFIGIGTALIAVMIPSLIAVIPLLWAKAAAWTAVAIATLAANLPLLLIVAGIALVVAGIVLLIQHWDWIVEKIPFLGVALDAVKAAMAAVLDWITGTFVPAIVGGVTAVIEFFKANWPLIMSIIQPVLDAIKAYIELWWNILKAVFEGGFKIIQGLLDVFIGIFTGDWERVLDGVKQIVDGFWTIIKGVFSAAFDFIVSIVQAGLDLIDAIFGGALDAIKSLIQGAWDSITNSVQAFMTGFTNAISAGWEAVKSLFNESLSAIGNAVSGYIDTFYNYGVALVQGLWNGIASMSGWITGQVRALGESIYGSVKAGLGKLNPLSPSEYGIEVGYYFGEGIVVGVNNATPAVTKSVTGLRKDIEDSFDVKSLEDLAGGYSLGVYGKIRDIAAAAGMEAAIWTVPLKELATMIPIANEYQEIVNRIEFEDAWNGIAEGMVAGISTGTKTTEEQFNALHQSMLKFSDYVQTGFTDMETALKWAADDAADILNDAQLTGAQWAEEFRKHPQVAGLAFNELNDHMRAELGKSEELLTAWKDAALIVYEDFSIQTDGLVKPVYDAMQGIAGALDGSKADFIDYSVSVAQSMAQLAALLQNTPTFNGVGGLVTAEQTGSPSGSDYVIGPGGQLIRVPKLAGGTRSADSGLALVGERGPELVNFDGGESVISARETARMLRGWGTKEDAPTDSGIDVNFYNATVVATDRSEARRAGNDVGWAVMAGLKSRGAA